MVRRLAKLACMATAIGVSSTLMAAEVTPEQAQTAVHNWIKKSSRRMTAKFAQSKPKSVLTSKKANALYHIVNLEAGGYVVTAGDTKLPPVIAFSESGSLDLSDVDNPLVVLLESDLAKRNSLIANLPTKASTVLHMRSAKSHTQSFEEEWASLLAEEENPPMSVDSTVMAQASQSSVTDTRVAPLVKSKWGQSKWNGDNTFNYYITNNYVCGCVATAFAQIMRFWRSPESATAGIYDCWVDGEKVSMATRGGTYDWDNMPLTSDSCFYLGQRMAIGKLLYDVGVVSQMGWTSTSSSTIGCLGGQALRNHFGYASAHSYHGDEMSTELSLNEAYRNAILASLDAGMPVSVSVKKGDIKTNDHEGHQVVVDGYGYNNGATVLYCHLNCGWNGSEDVWYNLMGEDVTSHAYTSLNGVCYNIHPSVSGDVISGRVLNAAGNPVSGAIVALTASGGFRQTTSTNEKGIYSFRARASLTYSVVATFGGLSSIEKSVSLPASSDTEWKATAHSANGTIHYVYSTSPREGALGNSWGNDLTLVGTVSPPAAPVLSIATRGASNANTSYIELTWEAVANATSYNVYRNTSSSADGRAKIAIGAMSPYKDYKSSSSLTPGVKYYYWIEAVNSSGACFSDCNWGNILVSATLKPQSLGFTSAGGTSNVVVAANTSWTATTSDSWLSISSSGTTSNGTIAVTATPNTSAGSRKGRVIVRVGSGTSYPKVLTNEVSQAANFSLLDALDNTTLQFTTGGDSSWLGQTSQTHDGVDAAKSGKLGDNQANWLETTVSGPGTISFWWYVSCEGSTTSTNWDYLAVFVDNVEKARICGTGNSWAYKSFSIPTGSHVIRWMYRKDYSQSEGEDAGFVDQVTWTPNSDVLPNLAPFAPKGWSSPLVVSGYYDNHINYTATSFSSAEDLYVSWAFTCTDADTTERIRTYLYIDGVKKNGWYIDGLKTGRYACLEAYSIGRLSVGTHTIKVVFDALYGVDESNEGDNTCTKTITITEASEYKIVFESGVEIATGAISYQTVGIGKVAKLNPCAFAAPAGKKFAGWRGDNGRRYDDGIMVFNLAGPGEVVTLTAVWE